MTDNASDNAPRPSEPRLAATVLLLRDDPFEVLMVRRHARAVFASALVFPGGAVDPGDSDEKWLPLLDGADDLTAEERAIRIAAVRETFEETSVLLATRADGGKLARPAATGVSFREVVEAAGGHIDVSALVPFGHWITPDAEPRRFDTHFLLAAAPGGQEPVSDGGETVALEWARPIDLIERAEAGERSIMFPTLMNLKRLAETEDTESALAAAHARPRFKVEAQVQVRPDGSRVIVIPAEAGYALTEYPAGSASTSAAVVPPKI